MTECNYCTKKYECDKYIYYGVCFFEIEEQTK